MHRTSILVLVPALVGVTLAGCGGSSGGINTSTPQGACQALTDALNQKFVSCFDLPADEFPATGFPVYQSYTCPKLATATSASPPTIAFDATKVAACQSEIMKMSCGDVLAWLATPGLSDVAPSTPSCMQVFAGKVASGGACNSNTECAGGGGCFGTTCPGKCTAPTPVGGDCTSSFFCAYPAQCLPNPADPTGMTYKCISPVANGSNCASAPCGNDSFCNSMNICAAQQTSGSCDPLVSQCAIGYNCVAPAGASMGTCQKVLTSGAACTPGQNLCAIGLYCGSAKTCVEDPGPAGACGTLTSGEFVGCNPTNGWCNAAPGAMGVCQPLVAQGKDCSSPNAVCQAGLTCDSTTNTCKPATCY